MNSQSPKSKQLRRNKNINKDGTLGGALTKHLAELNAIKNQAELITFIESLRSEVTETEYFNQTLASVKTSSFVKGYKMLYDICLKGEGLSINYL